MAIKKKILVVEDDGILLKVLVERLNQENLYEVFMASDGEEAIGQILENKPRLILLDLVLPKIDGFEVLKQIRESPDPEISGIKVVILSNLWSDKDILRVKHMQVEDYFIKANANLDQIMSKVNKLLINA